MSIESGGSGERAEGAGLGLVGRALQVALGVAAVALAARVSAPVPGSDVPQSGQTLAVVLVGALLGHRLGAAALLAYVGAGALGAPVFSDGGAGWAHLVGPTAGYLAGFVAAAGAVGVAAERGWTTRLLPALGVFLVAHALILGSGWGWLAVSTGPGAAWHDGVAPFLAGGVVKSLIAAAVTTGWAWRGGGFSAAAAPERV